MRKKYKATIALINQATISRMIKSLPVSCNLHDLKMIHGHSIKLVEKVKANFPNCDCYIGILYKNRQENSLLKDRHAFFKQ
jgi:hypothetical protein